MFRVRAPIFHAIETSGQPGMFAYLPVSRRTPVGCVVVLLHWQSSECLSASSSQYKGVLLCLHLFPVSAFVVGHSFLSGRISYHARPISDRKRSVAYRKYSSSLREFVNPFTVAYVEENFKKFQQGCFIFLMDTELTRHYKNVFL